MIIAFIGDVGSGKTLSMTYLLYNSVKKPREVQRIFRFLYGDLCYFANVEYTIHANYSLYDMEFKSIPPTLEGIDSIQTKRSILGLDELWQSADSRESVTLPNKTLSRFFAQSRKRLGDSSHLFHSAQYLHTVDVRIRNLTPFLICPTIVLYLDTETNRKKPIKTKESDLPYLIELGGYKKAYLGDYELISSYPIKVKEIVKHYNYEEYIPPLQDTTIDDMREKYEILVKNGDITTKKKLYSILVLDEKLPKESARILSDRIM